MKSFLQDEKDKLVALDLDFTKLQNKKLCIFGATGFVGKCLVDLLTFADKELNLSLELHLVARNHENLLDLYYFNNKVRIYEQDVCEVITIKNEFDYIVDCCYRPITNDYIPNIKSAQNIAKFSLLNKSKVLYLSSGAIYGNQFQIGENKESSYCKSEITNNPLVATKRLAEKIYFDICGDNCKIARLFTFAEPHLDLEANFAFSSFIKNKIKNLPLKVVGNSVRRSYLYSVDLAVWLIKILLSDNGFQIYNVGSDSSILLAELAEKISNDVQIVNSGFNSISSDLYIPNLAKIKSELKVKENYKLEEIIEKTLLFHNI